METIHLKTIDPVSQALLQSAARRGIDLNWERYERLQPQDGFLRLGLSCPYGCLQGPCRIDPFERGPRQGACGLDRDGMVAAMLLRICLQGVLDAGAMATANGTAPDAVIAAPLAQMTTKALADFDPTPLSTAEIFQAASLLQRPGESAEFLLQRALRLCLLTLGFVDKTPAPTGGEKPMCRTGYGLAAGPDVRIGVSGRISPDLIDALMQQARQSDASSIRLISLGDWLAGRDGFVPIACTSAEAELLVSSGGISLLLAGPGTEPGLIQTCRALNVPIQSASGAVDFEKLLADAGRAAGGRPQGVQAADPTMIADGRVVTTSDAFSGACRDIADRMVLVGGADTLMQPLGYLPVELASALRGESARIAAWGDAALWLMKSGLTSDEAIDPVLLLDAYAGPWLAVKALTAAGKIGQLDGICFTGLKACRDLNLALGLAFAGLKVNVAVPLPIWGSELVCRHLAALLGRNGGRLTHYDHPAELGEILDDLAG